MVSFIESEESQEIEKFKFISDRFFELRKRAQSDNLYASAELLPIFHDYRKQFFVLRKAFKDKKSKFFLWDSQPVSLLPSTVKYIPQKDFYLTSFDFRSRDEILLSFFNSWKGSFLKGEEKKRKEDFYSLSSDSDFIKRLHREVCEGSFKENRRFAFVDIETTSLDPIFGDVIEIGVVLKNGEGSTLIEISELYGLSSDDTVVGKSEIHGLEIGDLAGREPFIEGDSLIELQSILCDESITVVAHNSDFEYLWLSLFLPGFFESHTDFYGIPSNVLDTLLVSKIILEGSPNNKLSTFAEGCLVDYRNGHRALPDARMTAEAFFNLMKDFSRRRGRRSVFPLRVSS